MNRRNTRTVAVGKTKIGSGYPVSIQSMTKTDTCDIVATVNQVKALEDAGCEIVRIAVKTSEAAKALSSIKKQVKVPIVADIHFDYKLALDAIGRGVDKIRINPGNINKEDEIDKIAEALKSNSVALRIGVNSGSLMDESKKYSEPSQGMVETLLGYLKKFEDRGVRDIVLSLKSSEVGTSVRAYRSIAGKCDYPLHLGITSSGLPEDGIIKSSIGIGSLLLDGIGDTVRVSLTGDPVEEVLVAKRILSAAGVRKFGPNIISCPTCGRCQVDLVSLVKELSERLKGFTKCDSQSAGKQFTVALMGCEVNGPGEAKVADIGIAFGKGKGVIFKEGKIIKTVDAKNAINELIDIIRKM